MTDNNEISSRESYDKANPITTIPQHADVLTIRAAALEAKAKELIAQAEQIRKQERDARIASIQSQMREHGLTVDDLRTCKPAASKSKLPAKYKGPNGELWAGGPGRKPGWVKSALDAGKSLDQYLIA